MRDHDALVDEAVTAGKVNLCSTESGDKLLHSLSDNQVSLLSKMLRATAEAAIAAASARTGEAVTIREPTQVECEQLIQYVRTDDGLQTDEVATVRAAVEWCRVNARPAPVAMTGGIEVPEPSEEEMERMLPKPMLDPHDGGCINASIRRDTRRGVNTGIDYARQHGRAKGTGGSDQT